MMTCTCHDCNQQIEIEYQAQFRGDPLPIVTCRNTDCTLWGVTLSVDVYNNLTEQQLTDYRAMVANLKARFANLGSK